MYDFTPQRYTIENLRSEFVWSLLCEVMLKIKRQSLLEPVSWALIVLAARCPGMLLFVPFRQQRCSLMLLIRLWSLPPFFVNTLTSEYCSSFCHVPYWQHRGVACKEVFTRGRLQQLLSWPGASPFCMTLEKCIAGDYSTRHKTYVIRTDSEGKWNSPAQFAIFRYFMLC